MTLSTPRLATDREEDRAMPERAGCRVQRLILSYLFEARRIVAGDDGAIAERAGRAAALVDRAAALFKLWKSKRGTAHVASAARFKAASKHLVLLQSPDRTSRRSTNTDVDLEEREEIEEIASLLRRCEVDAVVLVASLVEPSDIEVALAKARRKARKRFEVFREQAEPAAIASLRKAVRAESALGEAASPYFEGIDEERTSQLRTLEMLADRLLSRDETAGRDAPASRRLLERNAIAEGKKLYGRKARPIKRRKVRRAAG